MSYLQEVLAELGDTSPIYQMKAISGGSINKVMYVETGKSCYAVKTHTNMPENFFIQEAMGLSALSCSVRVPKVYHYHYSDATGEASLWLEWIPRGLMCTTAEEELGRKLANLHQTSHTSYGFIEDNYLAVYPQCNVWSNDWISFFRDNRLQVQLDRSDEKGLLNKRRREKLDRLMDHLEEYIPASPKPSLLHGDLWNGNAFIAASGEPVFIDPAVSYGDHEVDLAMTELFGGFSARFYDAYQEINPISKQYEDRKPIYQLYYLLVHLNYYGEAYGQQVDAVLDCYM